MKPSNLRKIEQIRDQCNPSRGRQAYVSASSPCPHISKPCELQVAPIYPDPPVESDIITPSCIAVRSSNNPDEVLQDFAWDENLNQYVADDGSTASYNGALGWSFSTTQGGSYSTENPGPNPVGLYCNSEGDFISVMGCDKGIIPVELPDCVTLEVGTDEDLVLDTFSESNGQYTPDNAGQGTLFYDGNNWIYTVNGATYIGPSTEEEPYGCFQTSDGDILVFTVGCEE